MTRRRQIWDILYPTVFLFFCMILSSAVVLIAAGAITGIRNTEELQEQIHTLPLFASLLAYIVTLLYNKKYIPSEEARFGKDENHWKIWQIVAACAVALAAGLLWSHILTHSVLMRVFPGYLQNAAGAFEGQPFPLLLVTTVIAGPLAEEWMFRGMTYRRIRSVLGIWPAAILAALLFGIYHANMIQFLYAFPLGILFAWYYEKSGTILVPILAHIVVNFGACFFSEF